MDYLFSLGGNAMVILRKWKFLQNTNMIHCYLEKNIKYKSAFKTSAKFSKFFLVVFFFGRCRVVYCQVVTGIVWHCTCRLLTGLQSSACHQFPSLGADSKTSGKARHTGDTVDRFLHVSYVYANSATRNSKVVRILLITPINIRNTARAALTGICFSSPYTYNKLKRARCFYCVFLIFDRVK